MGYLVMPKTIK